MNDNETHLRVVETKVDEGKRALIEYLREAIEMVEGLDVVGIQISLVKADGDLITITSESDQRHLMVAAAAYQLFDIISAGSQHR
jgi:predicted SnoaL-like aldol condensation-catalyzing enzyme